MKEIVFLLCFLSVNGHMHFRLRIPNGFNVPHPCPGKEVWEAVGHMQTHHTTVKNVFGLAFRNNSKSWTRALCMEDSDGDGLTNGEELGDPLCKWATGSRAPGKARGHPGFCEPNRQKCTSGMTYSECPNPKAKDVVHSKPRIRLPPGANDHPQTRKLKEIMRNRNPNSRNRVGRPNFTTLPGNRQRWQTPQNTVISNDITRPTMRPRMPVVGQSVFGQGTYGSSRNTGGSFNNRDRHRQPISLSRDFGMTENGNVESTIPRNSFDDRINRFASLGRQNTRFMSDSFQRQPSRWNSFSDGSTFRRDSMSNLDQRSMSRDRSSFNRMPSNDVRSGMDTMSDGSRVGLNSDMQSSNRRHGSNSGLSNSLPGTSGDQRMTGPGMTWASLPPMSGLPRPGMPGMARPGMPGIPLPGGGMPFPPFV